MIYPNIFSPLFIQSKLSRSKQHQKSTLKIIIINLAQITNNISLYCYFTVFEVFYMVEHKSLLSKTYKILSSPNISAYFYIKWQLKLSIFNKLCILDHKYKIIFYVEMFHVP